MITPIRHTRLITVRYTSIDRVRKVRHYTTLEGARKFAQTCVGEYPDIGTIGNYAVSSDGIGKITVEGASLKEIFPGA